jgi:8-oxo-dGTP pyrophosphatase MutT (NUDIX family)
VVAALDIGLPTGREAVVDSSKPTLPRITNAHLAPVIGTDAHLPAIAALQLTADALRERFRRRVDWQPEFTGDGRLFTEREPADAAVLVALVERNDGLHVLLTRRTEHLRDHAGQISFPGGRTDTGDGGPVGTALREAEEEIALPRERLQVIGQLPAYTTVSSYVVTPVLALVQPPLALSDLRLQSSEVAEVFEVPLLHLMNPAHHQRHLFSFEGGERQFLSMPWRGPALDGSLDGSLDGTTRDYFIWGATAAMLRNLYRFIAA